MPIRIATSNLRGLPTNTGISTPGLTSFGAGVGQATQQAAGDIGRMAVDFQKTENLNRTREADTFYEQQVNQIKTEYANLNGKEQYDGLEEYNSRLEKAKSQALDMLENPVQRDLIHNVLTRRESDAKTYGGLQAAKGLKQWQVDTLDAQVTMHGEEATRNYGTREGNLALASMMENIEDKAEIVGAPPEQVTVMKVQAQSAVIANAIKGRVEADPWGAQKLFSENRDKMIEKDRVAAEAIVKGHTDKARAFATADGLIQKYGSPDAPELNEELKSVDPEIRTMVRQELDFQSARAERIKRKAEKDNEDASWQAIYSDPNPTNRMLPAPGSVSSSSYAAMQQYILRREQNGGIAVDDRDALQSLTLMAGGTQADREKFLALDIPGTYGGLLTKKTVDDMVQAQTALKLGKITTDPKVGAFVTKAEAVKRAVDLAGFKKKDDAGKAAYANEVSVKLAQMAHDKGRDLTSEEMVKAVNDMTYLRKAEVVTKDGLLGFIDTDTPLSEAEFTTKDGTVWPSRFTSAAALRIRDLGGELTTSNMQSVLDQLEKGVLLRDVKLPQ